MAFPQPNTQRELTNRKILEELQIKKQLLLKQGVASTLNATSLPVLGSANVASPENHSMQRTALQTANAQSTGFFISQDSSFGNLILPVLPRFDVNNMYSCARLRHIEERLLDVDGFERPKVLLEQYVTPAHLGSHFLHTVQSQYGDVEGKLVGDLGCGCGALTVGAAFLGAALVVGFEVDADALDVFRSNCEEYDNVDAVQCDALNISTRWEKQFDTIIMNPPFGTKKNAGIDMKFLEAALKLSRNAVYSLHKTSTRSHVLKVAKANGVAAEVLAELRYDLPSTYRFHKKQSVDVEVDLFRFSTAEPPE